MLVGVRPDICTIEVPSRTREVSRPHHASGVKASDPQASAVKIASNPASSAAATSSPCVRGRLRAPVAQLQSQLHGAEPYPVLVSQN